MSRVCKKKFPREAKIRRFVLLGVDGFNEARRDMDEWFPVIKFCICTVARQMVSSHWVPKTIHFSIKDADLFLHSLSVDVLALWQNNAQLTWIEA